ncbi:hypothetical protein [Morganella morganii]|uniref:DUF1471 domain-containing protein n=1 Tax=Morganella morganii TaxID=582 RepID=A0A0D8L9I7_MORMO|nr:hypothetical protein [Morganella morganii]KJF78434.1 hypothetical protein UA45_06205 [Morganella morganii]MCU6224605.1 hypothetical protein [Morganella morganii]MCU6232413.1 hypothetical protein [Morganella morganii]
MLKTFRITGYAVNKRGLTVGFNQTISATSQKQAQQQAIAECEASGQRYIRITRMIEVRSHA